MASANSPMTFYQCSECEHCSSTLDDATMHAYEAHRPEAKDDEDGIHFAGFEELDDDVDEDHFYPNKRFKQDKNDLSFELNIQSSSPPKSNKNGSIYIADVGSLKRADMWQSENTTQLINCVRENMADLKNRTLRKKHIWEKIRAIVAIKMPGITSRQCQQKWRNLLNSQKKYMISSKTPKRRVKRPEFYDEIAALVGDDIYNIGEGTSDLDPLSVPMDYDNHKILLDSLEEEPLKLSAFEISDDSTDSTSILLKILNTLESKEMSGHSFQRQIIEIEKSKLQSMSKYIDMKERQNLQKIQLLKDYLNTASKKRNPHHL